MIWPAASRARVASPSAAACCTAKYSVEASPACLFWYQFQPCQPTEPSAATTISVVTYLPYCSHQALIWEICSCSSRSYSAIVVLVFSELMFGHRVGECVDGDAFLGAGAAQRLECHLAGRVFVLADVYRQRGAAGIGLLHLRIETDA